MPVEIKWHLEPLIVLTTITGEMTTAEAEVWLRDYIRIIDASPGIVHSIIDLRLMTRISANLVKTPSVFEALRHAHSGWTMLIGTTPLTSFWLQILGRVTPIQFKLVTSIEESEEFLLALVRIAETEA